MLATSAHASSVLMPADGRRLGVFDLHAAVTNGGGAAAKGTAAGLGC